MAYVEIDEDGLAVGFWGLEVMSINGNVYSTFSESDLFEEGQLITGGSLNVRLATPWFSWSAWLDANGLEIFTTKIPAKVAPGLQPEEWNTPLPFSELDEPTDADLAELEAWIAIERLHGRED